MPEGDTIHHAAAKIRPVLEGRVPDAIETPHPRFGRDRWPGKLGGHAVRSVDAHGKHLFLRFENGLTIHSHLRMTGLWRVVPAGGRWPRSPRRAWLVIRARGSEVVQFDGPVLELVRDSRTRLDPLLAGLGPDVLAMGEFDHATYLRRLREDDPTRPIGDTLLDQRVLAGYGTVWRSEACWAAAVDPWRPTGRVTDEEARDLVELIRPVMQRAAATGSHDRQLRVYNREGRPCPRCGTRIRLATQGDNNRPLFWCPGCQR